jgi:electron transport complex protein RnfG
MKYIIDLGIRLLMVCAVSAGGLALLNAKTSPIIAEYRRMEQVLARREVMPTAAQGVFVLEDSTGDLPYYEAYSDPAGKQLVGYVFSTSNKGYSSNVETVVGVDLQWKITGIKVTSQQETPGLGSKSTEIKYGEKDSWFQRQFKNKLADIIKVDKDGGDIQSITGATITSRAITDAIRNKTKLLKDKLSSREKRS